jgi:hypothetical protein
MIVFGMYSDGCISVRRLAGITQMLLEISHARHDNNETSRMATCSDDSLCGNRIPLTSGSIATPSLSATQNQVPIEQKGPTTIRSHQRRNNQPARFPKSRIISIVKIYWNVRPTVALLT